MTRSGDNARASDTSSAKASTFCLCPTSFVASCRLLLAVCISRVGDLPVLEKSSTYQWLKTRLAEQQTLQLQDPPPTHCPAKARVSSCSRSLHSGAPSLGSSPPRWRSQIARPPPQTRAWCAVLEACLREQWSHGQWSFAPRTVNLTRDRQCAARMEGSWKRSASKRPQLEISLGA